MSRRQEIALWAVACVMVGPRLLDAWDQWWRWSNFGPAAQSLGEALLVLLPLIVFGLRVRGDELPGGRLAPYLIAALMIAARSTLAVADHLGDAASSCP